MPEGNSDAYKEMYEMGTRLVEMAKSGGYDPDTNDMDSDEGESYSEMDSPKKPMKGGHGSASDAMRFFGG